MAWDKEKSMISMQERSDDSFIYQANREPGERRPVLAQMTDKEIWEFESKYVLWNQKIDGTPKIPAVVILEVQDIGTVREPTYLEAIQRAKAMRDAEGL
jgi:hypothetical protein